MNVLIKPGIVVSHDTVVDATVLNAGFSPTATLEGGIESTDLGNGSITVAKLNAALISNRNEEIPTETHRLMHETGGQRGRMSISEIPDALPWYVLGEEGFDQAAATTTTTNDDFLALRTQDGVRRAPLTALTAGDVTTAGTYRTGQVTIDNKGRVLSTAVANYWSTGWSGVPPKGTTFTWEHDLRRRPALIQAWLKCVSNVGEAGYEYGEIVPAEVLIDGASGLPYLCLRADESRVSAYGMAGATGPLIARADGATPAAITFGKWQLMVNVKL